MTRECSSFSYDKALRVGDVKGLVIAEPCFHRALRLFGHGDLVFLHAVQQCVAREAEQFCGLALVAARLRERLTNKRPLDFFQTDALGWQAKHHRRPASVAITQLVR
jgi:hypothetical protein